MPRPACKPQACPPCPATTASPSTWTSTSSACWPRTPASLRGGASTLQRLSSLKSAPTRCVLARPQAALVPWWCGRVAGRGACCRDKRWSACRLSGWAPPPAFHLVPTAAAPVLPLPPSPPCVPADQPALPRAADLEPLWLQHLPRQLSPAAQHALRLPSAARVAAAGAKPAPARQRQLSRARPSAVPAVPCATTKLLAS